MPLLDQQSAAIGQDETRPAIESQGAVTSLEQAEQQIEKLPIPDLKLQTSRQSTLHSRRMRRPFMLEQQPKDNNARVRVDSAHEPKDNRAPAGSDSDMRPIKRTPSSMRNTGVSGPYSPGQPATDSLKAYHREQHSKLFWRMEQIKSNFDKTVKRDFDDCAEDQEEFDYFTW